MLPGIGVSPAARVHDVRPRKGELDPGCGGRNGGHRDRAGADGPGVSLGCEARRAARLKRPETSSALIRPARLPVDCGGASRIASRSAGPARSIREEAAHALRSTAPGATGIQGGKPLTLLHAWLVVACIVALSF